MVPEYVPRHIRLKGMHLIGWLIGFAVFTLVVPTVLILIMPSDLKSAGIATLTASPVIEYMAISLGISLGIKPLISFLLTVLPCIGLCMLVFGLLGFIGDNSVRVRRFLEKIQKRVDKFPKLKKYGVPSSFVFVMFLGIYIGPGISILLGWPRIQSIVFMAGGISCITLLIGLATVGVINIFFI
jgi:hypothetical protein